MRVWNNQKITIIFSKLCYIFVKFYYLNFKRGSIKDLVFSYLLQVPINMYDYIWLSFNYWKTIHFTITNWRKNNFFINLSKFMQN